MKPCTAAQELYGMPVYWVTSQAALPFGFLPFMSEYMGVSGEGSKPQHRPPFKPTVNVPRSRAASPEQGEPSGSCSKAPASRGGAVVKPKPQQQQPQPQARVPQPRAPPRARTHTRVVPDSGAPVVPSQAPRTLVQDNHHARELLDMLVQTPNAFLPESGDFTRKLTVCQAILIEMYVCTPESVPTTITKCRSLIRDQLLICVRDFVENHRKGTDPMDVHEFNSRNQLRKHIKQTPHFLPLWLIKSLYLTPLLTRVNF